jgi:hypothetical protein
MGDADGLARKANSGTKPPIWNDRSVAGDLVIGGHAECGFPHFEPTPISVAAMDPQSGQCCLRRFELGAVRAFVEVCIRACSVWKFSVE